MLSSMSKGTGRVGEHCVGEGWMLAMADVEALAEFVEEKEKEKNFRSERWQTSNL